MMHMDRYYFDEGKRYGCDCCDNSFDQSGSVRSVTQVHEAKLADPTRVALLKAELKRARKNYVLGVAALLALAVVAGSFLGEGYMIALAIAIALMPIPFAVVLVFEERGSSIKKELKTEEYIDVTVPSESAYAYNKIRAYAKEIEDGDDHPVDAVVSARLADEAAPELLDAVADHLRLGSIESPAGQAAMGELARIEAEMKGYLDAYRKDQEDRAVAAATAAAAELSSSTNDVTSFTSGITFRSTTPVHDR